MFQAMISPIFRSTKLCKPLLLHLVGYPYCLCQWCMVKQISTIEHVQKSIPVYLCHVIPLWTLRLEGTVIKFWPMHSLCKLCNYGKNIQCCHIAFKFKFIFCSNYVSVKISQRDSCIWIFVKELHAGDDLSTWDSDCSGMLHGVDWYLVTNVSGKTNDPVFRGQGV
jgi:hypothetical protein